MLRTVLLCDIVDSTALIERLGDVRAVALLRHHDQLMRQNILLCHGQLIDKADGVLALFERPIQALDFALRYQRGLREVGAMEGLDLKARIGIHVGDVMTWANEPRDVMAGAKAVEVEGLAKPVAARLMNLARPGQILMSGMAQNLCQRAVGELGEAGAKLRWLMHGRYSFKGVPAPMLVHEVGEPGLSPLRAPESGAKAWRELPLWRRPPVLALEVLLVGVLSVALFWSAVRSPPAIAFAERDWVVVAELQNRTSESLFDQSLDTALRIGLEQSRHVNLLSELQIERALERMQRQGQPIDRQLGAELALREGAKAVILPTVAEVGGVVRVSLEVIDPNSGVTVHSENADSRDIAGVLNALDLAIAGVRTELGEGIKSVTEDNRPLERVTTGDIEALRAFSMGMRARSQGRAADAFSLFEEAVRRDPAFAMAWLRMAAIKLGSDLDEAKRYFDIAASHRDRLSDREALLMDASLGLFGRPDQMLQKWKLLGAMYPDEYRAFYNYSYFSHFAMQNYRDAAQSIEPALVSNNEARPAAYYMKGVSLLADERVDEALAAFKQSEALSPGGYRRDHAHAHAVRRDYAQAQRVLATQQPSGFVGALLNERLGEVSHALDRGRWDEALRSLQALEEPLKSANISTRQTRTLMQLSLRSYAPDERFQADLKAYLADQVTQLAEAHALNRPRLEFHLLAGGWLAANAGDLAGARLALDRVGDSAEAGGFPFVADMATLVRAEIDLQEGRPEAAVARLAPRAGAGNELYFLHAVLMRAQAAAGDPTAALAQAQWLAKHRGRAFAEPNAEYSWQLVNVVESNLAPLAAAAYAGELGRAEEAKSERGHFEAAWPSGEQLPAVQRRLASLD
ncbi:putative peptide modification system cyclase [Arenimonas alkanexedens]